MNEEIVKELRLIRMALYALTLSVVFAATSYIFLFDGLTVGLAIFGFISAFIIAIIFGFIIGKLIAVRKGPDTDSLDPASDMNDSSAPPET